MQILAIQEYGLRCLAQVALHDRAQPITAAQIASREGLGPEYVARIMRALRVGGLVSSTRGAAGGYHLARPAEQINVWQAMSVLGGEPFSDGFCQCRSGRRSECVHLADCTIRALWQKMEGTLRDTLERISLEDLRRDESAMSAWLGSAGFGQSQPRPQ